jgi:hypothetical protein
MMPATLSLIRLTFTDEKERAFAIGIWAAVASGRAPCCSPAARETAAAPGISSVPCR